MSVTFSMKNTKYVEAWDPELEMKITGPAEGYYEINISNTNFKDLMLAVGLLEDAQRYFGEWRLDELPNILQAFRRLQSIEGAFEKPTVETGNFIEAGRDSEYVKRRLAQFVQLITAAMDKGEIIVFS